MKTKSILILTPTFPYFESQEGVNGGSNFIFQKVKYLQKRGIKPIVVTSECPALNSEEKSKLQAEEKLSMPVHRFSYFLPRSLQKLTYMPAGVPDQLFVHKNLLAWIQIPFFLLSFFLRAIPYAKKCDVIHCHWALTAIPGLFLKILFNKPLFLTIREGNPNLISSNAIMRCIIRNCDFLIANTDEYFSHMKYCGADSSKFIKIRNGVSPKFNKLEKGISRKKLDIKDKDIIVVSASYLIPRKNPEILLDAFIDLHHNFPQIKLYFAGEGPLLRVLEEKVRANKCQNKVKFLGNISHEELNLIYNASDIFCLMTSSDGIANSVVEAMKCELPIITTNVGGFPEIIEDKSSGFLLESFDYNSLASLIKKLVQNPKMRKKVGVAARNQLIRKGIDWEINSKLHFEAYQKAFN